MPYDPPALFLVGSRAIAREETRLANWGPGLGIGLNDRKTFRAPLYATTFGPRRRPGPRACVPRWVVGFPSPTCPQLSCPGRHCRSRRGFHPWPVSCRGASVAHTHPRAIDARHQSVGEGVRSEITPEIAAAAQHPPVPVDLRAMPQLMTDPLNVVDPEVLPVFLAVCSPDLLLHVSLSRQARTWDPNSFSRNDISRACKFSGLRHLVLVVAEDHELPRQPRDSDRYLLLSAFNLRMLSITVEKLRPPCTADRSPRWPRRWNRSCFSVGTSPIRRARRRSSC